MYLLFNFDAGDNNLSSILILDCLPFLRKTFFQIDNYHLSYYIYIYIWTMKVPAYVVFVEPQEIDIPLD